MTAGVPLILDPAEVRDGQDGPGQDEHVDDDEPGFVDLEVPTNG
jgi:hypothetical protein